MMKTFNDKMTDISFCLENGRKLDFNNFLA